MEELDLVNTPEEQAIKKIKLKKLFTYAYDRIYFTANLRAQEDFSEFKKQSLINRDKLRFKKTKHRVIEFFGLPSGDSTKPIEILKSLAGWNDKYSTSRKLLQALFIFPINLLLAASKLALNIVKLGTEFLPYILAKGSLQVFRKSKTLLSEVADIKREDRDFSWAVAGTIGLLGCLLFGAITAACHLWYFIGGATTSPAENFRAAYRAGNDLCAGGKAGKILGSIFALVSALTSACVYAVLFPVLLTQTPAVLPAIGSFISQLAGIFGPQAAASTAAFFATTLPAALATFGATLSSLFEPLLMGVAASAAIGAGVMTPIVVAIDEMGETIEHKRIEHRGPTNYRELPKRSVRQRLC